MDRISHDDPFWIRQGSVKALEPGALPKQRQHFVEKLGKMHCLGHRLRRPFARGRFDKTRNTGRNRPLDII